MKKQWQWLIPVLALAAVLIAAALLYPKLSAQFLPETASTSAAEKKEAASASGDAQETNGGDTASEPQQTAADFVVFDAQKHEVRLSEKFGRPLVVNFWTSWCGPCRSELPAFDAAAEQYADEIEFMMVNLTDGYSETVGSVQAFIEENGFTFPVYFDERQEAAAAYSVYSIPLTVFIRADGTVLDSYVGSMSETILQSYLDQLLP